MSVETSIYALCEPDTMVVRYVGKTMRSVPRRVVEHVHNAKRGKSQLPVARWLRKQHAAGKRPVALELESVPAASDWVAREKHWIEFYRAFGGLLNLTDGGEGQAGRRYAGSAHAKKIGRAKRLGAYFKCENCPNQFWRKPRDIKSGDCRFCSRECFQASQRGVSKPVSAICTRRGVEAAAALRRARMVCKHGHSLGAENIRFNATGSRICKTCSRVRSLAYLARKKQ